MTPSTALAMTRNMVTENGQRVFIRRFSGTGPSRTKVDTPTLAYVRNYGSKELIGSIQQGDQSAVTLVDTLAAILPVLTTDKLVLAKDDGTAGPLEYSIKNPMKRVVGGMLIALEIHCSG